MQMHEHESSGSRQALQERKRGSQVTDAFDDDDACSCSDGGGSQSSPLVQ